MAVKEGSVLDVIMIKPSRYCDDGYPITRMRPLVPANTWLCWLWATMSTSCVVS